MLQPIGQPCHRILISLYSFNGCISSQLRVKTIINFKLPDWKSGCPRWILVVQCNQAFGIIDPGGTIYMYIAHRGQMTHICSSKLTIIGSDNGLSPGRCQLYEYFNKNNLLYKSQYGFHTLHSTELASLEIIDIIGKDLDNGKLPIGVFLDLSKAFDTLDHTILLDKLLYYGIKGTELAWFKSYLTNRTQFVSYNGTNSRTLTITTGVPQGSILGPLLFIIYMNDIHNASSKFHAILFAYDTNLTSTLCSFDVNIDNNCKSLQLSTNINKELKNIQIWLEINHFGNQSRGYFNGGRPPWPPAVSRLAARPSQSNPRGSGPEALKRERGHVTVETWSFRSGDLQGPPA